jgi:4-alpha-glucanotransferase
VYTGTHDNDTTQGWWDHGATEAERTAVYEYLNPVPGDVVWSLIRAGCTSVADVCLFPVQDILVLGSEGRMNTPAMPENNWTWRLPPGALHADQARGLAQLAVLTDRDGYVEPTKL